MALIDEVKKICKRLSTKGWRKLLLKHGLDIAATNLEAELLKELPEIDREIEGFEDFAAEGKRGIEPGNPSRSLLFHAIASPDVINGANGKELGAFPTLAEVETIENYVYGVLPPSLQDLTARAQRLAGGDRRPNMAIAVFASEYRPGPETEHRKHADMCFSRTGICRVGTAKPVYDARRRGFLSFRDGDDNLTIRVLPCKYSPYIAVQLHGDPNIFGPMNYREDIDKKINFWVPIHKLFNGTECIRNLDLHVTLESHHVNQKIKRINEYLKFTFKVETQTGNVNIEEPPFKFYEGIADLSKNPDFGTGLLIPTVHSSLVDVAKYNDQILSFLVPTLDLHRTALFDSSLQLSTIKTTKDIPRRAPEFIHIRNKVEQDGSIKDMNSSSNLVQELRKEILKGDYRALHYVDFTGDGWIEVFCPELGIEYPRPVPAYSLVTTPDFFPDVDQREIYEWWQQKVPATIRNNFWYEGGPNPLSDVRSAPNMELENDGAHFRSKDTSVTSIISLPPDAESRSSIQTARLLVKETMRHTYLPDGASGIFAPGWDTSFDIALGGQQYLASYSLGSPFAEDAKLCAALSAFWPAVAPDTGRSFWPVNPTVCPLTDEEIGIGSDFSWDGFIGPKIYNNSKDTVEYFRSEYVDYVSTALQNKFSLSQTRKVDINSYKYRMISMWRVYEAAGVLGPLATDASERAKWPVLSFREVTTRDKGELTEAQTQTGQTLQGLIYRVEIYRPGTISDHPEGDHRKIIVKIKERITSFVGSTAVVLVKHDDVPWRQAHTRTFAEP